MSDFDDDAPDGVDERPDPPPVTLPPTEPPRTLQDARSAPPPRFPAAPLPPILRAASVNVIGGSPFAGKTPLMAWLIRQFTEGVVLGHPVPEGAVSEHVFLAGSGSWQDTISTWFTGLPVRGYALHDDLAFSADQLAKRKVDRLHVLEEILVHLAPQPHALVWLDPLTMWFTGSLLEPDACYTSAFALRRLALQHQITLIGTAQGSKQKVNPQDRYVSLLGRIAGSSAVYGYLDTAFFLATPEECDRSCHTLGVYPRRAPQITVDLVQDPETGHFAYATQEQAETALHAAIAAPPDSTHVSELKSLLCRPTRPDGMDRATLYRHLRLLTERGVIRQVERGRYQKRKPS